MKIYAKDYDVLPGGEVAQKVNALFAKLAETEEEKELIFERGTYFLASENCPVEHYHITNTIGEKEYDEGEEKWRIVIGLHLKNIKNLVVDGNGSTFVIDGVATDMAIVGCENVTVKNLETKVLRPNVHKLHITKRSMFSAEMTLDADDRYEVENGQIYFVGKDYRYPLLWNRFTQVFNYSKDTDPSFLSRGVHPLARATKIEIKGTTIYAKGFFPRKKVKKGYSFYLFDWRRRQVGTFLWQDKNIKIENYTQRFSYSLSFVCQDCDTVTFERLNCSPSPESPLQYCSIADFIQICCCRGQFIVRDSYFSSSGDDVLNAHGIHFKIESIRGKEAVVKFCHPEAYGFNIFHAGDTLSVVGRKDLTEREQCKVVSSEMTDLYTVKLTLESEISSSYVGEVVENASACPDLLYENNEFERITTRGLLLTTRGKIVIRKNHFKYTKLNAVEIADDAMDWYESGMIRDLTIEENTFARCDSAMIHIFPHNVVDKGYVHKNITIQNNEFHLEGKHCYIVRSAGNVKITGNRYVTPMGYKKFLWKISGEIVKKDF